MLFLTLLQRFLAFNNHIYLFIKIKTLVNKTNSVDDADLAEQIINLSANGPSPNRLLLDLLDHSIASQVGS